LSSSCSFFSSFSSFLLCGISHNLLFPSWFWSPLGRSPFTFMFRIFFGFSLCSFLKLVYTILFRYMLICLVRCLSLNSLQLEV
jgi:hypothetical protein